MPTGTVKFFNSTKGFGFIQPDDKSKDVFVHVSAVERAGLGSLSEHQKIAYELAHGGARFGCICGDGVAPGRLAQHE